MPAGAGRLAAPLPAPYVYRSPWKRAAARALDAVGGALSLRQPSPDWSSLRRIAVLRLDHMGDLLNALPALRRLRRGLPRASLDLWVGPWGRDLAALFADVDAVRVADADWFRRPARRDWPWRQILGLGRSLRDGAYDAAFELRGELRHHLALRLAKIPVRAGQALTAGGFLLTQRAQWDPRLHERDQALGLLDQVGVPRAAQGREPYLRLPAGAHRRARGLARALGIGPRPLMVQAACGTAAKRWPAAHWAAFFRGLPRGIKPVLLGSGEERAEMRVLARKSGRPVAVAAGRLDLPGLAAFLSLARLLVSVDSGPAHLAALQGVPVLSLFSGTNRAAQWAPKGAGARVLHAKLDAFPCSPCELTQCPFENACMAALTPGAVLAETLKMIRRDDAS